jgi:hypothetical protein
MFARLAALGPDKSSWTVEFALVYISSINSLIKKAIERGLPVVQYHGLLGLVTIVLLIPIIIYFGQLYWLGHFAA